MGDVTASDQVDATRHRRHMAIHQNIAGGTLGLKPDITVASHCHAIACTRQGNRASRSDNRDMPFAIHVGLGNTIDRHITGNRGYATAYRIVDCRACCQHSQANVTFFTDIVSRHLIDFQPRQQNAIDCARLQARHPDCLVESAIEIGVRILLTDIAAFGVQHQGSGFRTTLTTHLNGIEDADIAACVELERSINTQDIVSVVVVFDTDVVAVDLQIGQRREATGCVDGPYSHVSVHQGVGVLALFVTHHDGAEVRVADLGQQLIAEVEHAGCVVDRRRKLNVICQCRGAQGQRAITHARGIASERVVDAGKRQVVRLNQDIA